MLFSNVGKTLTSCPIIVTLQGSQIELMSQYLVILIDDGLNFKPQIKNVVMKLKLKLGFYFRNKSCFPYVGRKNAWDQVPPLLDYIDLLFMLAFAQCWIWFITALWGLSKAAKLSLTIVQWPSTAFKSVLGLVLTYLCGYIWIKTRDKFLGSNDTLFKI